MRKYESIVVFDPKLSESDLKSQCEKIEKIIADNGGHNTTTDSWGKREFAYLVKKNASGNYVVFYFESEEQKIIDQIQLQFRLNESIIKFQTHKISEKVRKFKGRADGGSDEEHDFGV